MKILAISSAGGHWIQLQRLEPAFEGQEIIYVSTIKELKLLVKEHKFYYVPDANRWNKIKLIYTAFLVFKIILKTKPHIIITTGAAPGLMGIIGGKILGIKTIWIDSIANAEKLSLSGKIASKIATKCYTQWPSLSNSRIIFKGNVIS